MPNAKKESDIINNMGNWNHFNIIRKISENPKGNHKIKQLQKVAMFGTAYLLQKLLIKKYKTFNMGSNITCTTDCNYSKAVGRYKWKHGLRGGSATAHLLGLRVRIPMGYEYLSWMLHFVQIEASARGRSLLQGSCTECIVVNECDQVRRLFCRRCPSKQEKNSCITIYIIVNTLHKDD
jgi:hypothetical protein